MEANYTVETLGSEEPEIILCYNFNSLNIVTNIRTKKEWLDLYHMYNSIGKWIVKPKPAAPSKSV